MDYKLPLRNIKREIVDYTSVSEEDFPVVNKFKWHKSNGYVACGNPKYRLHRYIMIEILGHKIDSKSVVDHIDNNPLNNRRDNLRIVTFSENMRNKKKKENCSSNYIGVNWNIKRNKWQTSIAINKKSISAYYDNEHHSAYQYNLWCYEYELTTANLNEIPEEELNDFIIYEKKERKLPKNITLTKQGNFKIEIKGKYIGIYETEKEAEKIRGEKLKELAELEEKKRLEIPIKRNDKGECFIEIFNKNKENVAEAIVDEDLYYDLIKCSWCLSNGYAHNLNLGIMHRYVMNYNGYLLVDHINGNKLDNRKENLRIATPKQNAQNRSSRKNSSSKYIGVNKVGKKYRAYITIDRKTKYLGTFEIEEDAARAYDEAAKEYKGEHARLNFKD